MRNFNSRSLADVKAAHLAATAYYTYSASIVDIEIDITTSLGAIVTDLSYITTGSTYLPFSSPLTESNEATISSIALREKRSNT